MIIWKWDGRDKETCKRFYSKYKIPVNHVICEWLIFTHSSSAIILSVTCFCSPNLVQKKLLPLFKRSAASNTKAGDKDQMVIVSTQCALMSVVAVFATYWCGIWIFCWQKILYTHSAVIFLETIIPSGSESLCCICHCIRFIWWKLIQYM